MTGAAKVPIRPTAASLPPWLLLATLLAASIPTLLAYHQPPSATLLNQCLAVALWGVVEAPLAPARWCRATGPLLAALAALAWADERGSWAWRPARRRAGSAHGPPMRASPSPS